MRVTRASLLGIALLALGLAAVPVDARTASRGHGGHGGRAGGAAAGRPSYGGHGAVRSPQRATAPRPVASGRATATRPGGGGSAPHYTQGKATWGYGGGYGGYYGHGGYGYPYYGYPYYGYGYPSYGYPCGWWGGYYPWGWGVSIGWGAAYGGAYAEPVPVPYDPAESGQVPEPQGGGYPAWVETDVVPKRASVRLDGEDVGFAKDWNGVWDRLTIPSGTHVLEFALEGHQTLQVHLDAQPGRVYHVRRELQKGEGLDARSSTEAPERSAPPQAPAPPSRGFLRLSIEPADAAVYLDGGFVGRASDLHLTRSTPLPSGEHDLEVVRPGYRPERQTVVVPAGAVQELRIELDPEPSSEPREDVSFRDSAGSSPV